MANSTMDENALKKRASEMARGGRTITAIAEELGIRWEEARRLIPTTTWQGAKAKITRRLNKLATEPDQAKRETLAAQAGNYADFLFDAAKHLRGQVDSARKALNR